jgi:hypothetical protein
MFSGVFCFRYFLIYLAVEAPEPDTRTPVGPGNGAGPPLAAASIVSPHTKSTNTVNQ